MRLFVRRLTSVFLMVALLSCFCCLPAHAASLSGSSATYLAESTSVAGLATSYKSFGSLSYPSTGAVLSTDSTTRYRYYSFDGWYVPLEDVTSNVVLVISYYYSWGAKKYFDCYDYDNTYNSGSIEYTNQYGNTGTGNIDSLSNWTPSSSSALSSGITVTGTFVGSEEAPIRNLCLKWDPRVMYARCTADGSGTDFMVYIVDARVIQSSAPSADLKELQNIASAIAEQNELLSAMYGDILAVCNSIYERNGSILEAQQMTNAYFEAIIPVLNGISSTTNDIYKLLGAQFELLISTIQTESDDIQSTIDNAVQTLIAYFDSAFAGSVNPNLPGQSQDITDSSSSFGDAESGYQSTATERFDAISADFSGFDGSILSGVALGSSLFQRVWVVLDDYVIIYTFPLTLSICLVVVGRVSRYAARERDRDSRKSSGGKGKGGSG